MHTGDEVYITRTGKYYHYFDDDCPTVSRIRRGTTAARIIKEEEAKQMGYTICSHCFKEYAEDLSERQGCGATAIFFLAAGIGASAIFNILSKI